MIWELTLPLCRTAGDNELSEEEIKEHLDGTGSKRTVQLEATSVTLVPGGLQG